MTDYEKYLARLFVWIGFGCGALIGSGLTALVFTIMALR